MGEYDALISRRFAVEFFEKTKFPERGLEIYIEACKAKRFATYLVEVENYQQKMPIERFG